MSRWGLAVDDGGEGFDVPIGGLFLVGMVGWLASDADSFAMLSHGLLILLYHDERRRTI